MLNPFGALGDLQKLQQQAQKMQAALQQEEVVIEKNGVKVIIRGDQIIESIEVDGIVENRIAEVVNEAVKKTQELAAKKLIEISSQQLQGQYLICLNYFLARRIQNYRMRFLSYFMSLLLNRK